MIEKLIHQTWKNKNLRTYGDGITGLVSRKSWKLNFPDFEYQFWTNKDILELLETKYQFALNAYYKLDYNIKKVDLARYIILYDQGGIYSDLDFISKEPIPRHMIENYDFPPLMAMITDIVNNSNSSKYPLFHTGPERFHQIMLQTEALKSTSTYIFDFDEVNNSDAKSVYGYHSGMHDWHADRKSFLIDLLKLFRSLMRQTNKNFRVVTRMLMTNSNL